jgi:hypothetical protein
MTHLLLPCPFCGGTPGIEVGDTVCAWVACDCGAEGPGADDADEAERLWNDRVRAGLQHKHSGPDDLTPEQRRMVLGHVGEAVKALMCARELLIEHEATLHTLEIGELAHTYLSGLYCQVEEDMR